MAITAYQPLNSRQLCPCQRIARERHISYILVCCFVIRKGKDNFKAWSNSLIILLIVN